VSDLLGAVGFLLLATLVAALAALAERVAVPREPQALTACLGAAFLALAVAAALSMRRLAREQTKPLQDLATR
jgi:hypothetical protein